MTILSWNIAAWHNGCYVVQIVQSICEQAMGLSLGVNITAYNYNHCVCNCCYGHVQFWDKMSFSLYFHCYLGGHEWDAPSCLGPVWYPVHVSLWWLQDVFMCSSLGVVLMLTCIATSTFLSHGQLCVRGLLTSVLVYIQGLQSGHLVTWPGQLCLYMLGGYCHTAWLAVQLWFTNLCAGYWIDSGWRSYV